MGYEIVSDRLTRSIVSKSSEVWARRPGLKRIPALLGFSVRKENFGQRLGNPGGAGSGDEQRHNPSRKIWDREEREPIRTE
jgi:hypothetical protein